MPKIAQNHKIISAEFSPGKKNIPNPVAFLSKSGYYN
jgi:hypothetical protein